jgi:cytochrome c2
MRMPYERMLLGAVVALALAGCSSDSYPGRDMQDPVWAVPGGDSQRGAQAIVRHGCFACHVIAGIRQADGRVGPKLLDIQRQIYIGGVLPNSPDSMIRWLQDPRVFSPETAMPDLGVTEQEARDIAAYLYSQS